MKNVILIPLAVLMFSCENENNKKLFLVKNNFSAKKNNADWNGVLEISENTNTDTVTFFASANIPNHEVLVMKIKFDGPRTYVLENTAFYYSTVGGDVITSMYVPGPNTTGVLKVLEYNKSENVMKGTFEVRLIKAWSNPENDLDALDFTNGAFKGEIRQQN